MEGRIKHLNESKHSKNILYLMNRDQRIFENYSIQLAYELSYESKTNLYIGFDYINMKMNERQKIFILQGLLELSETSKNYSLPIYLVNDFKSFIEDFEIDCVVVDFSPLREIKERDKQILQFCKSKKIALYSCDSHNVVPCSLLSVYKRTPKAVKCDLYKLYNRYLNIFNRLEIHKYNQKELFKTRKIDETKDFQDFLSLPYLNDTSFINPINNFINEKSKSFNKEYMFKGGYNEGIKIMHDFFKRFHLYAKERNNPDVMALSNLSPWIHTGQLSNQFIIIEATEKFKNSDSLQTLIDEMCGWKAISEHFVYHEPNYDNLKGALPWARDSLKIHSVDKRPIIYTENQLRRAKTSDKLWNSAQNELLITGKIHGYVRMYWAKRLLEWTKSPEEALAIGLTLNDEYSIDGNDTNGYLGVMWSICASMDRAFQERPIFGKIRFMKSFKCPGYISKWSKIL